MRRNKKYPQKIQNASKQFIRDIQTQKGISKGINQK